jgi:hypothetical protein
MKSAFFLFMVLFASLNVYATEIVVRLEEVDLEKSCEENAGKYEVFMHVERTGFQARGNECYRSGLIKLYTDCEGQVDPTTNIGALDLASKCDTEDMNSKIISELQKRLRGLRLNLEKAGGEPPILSELRFETKILEPKTEPLQEGTVTIVNPNFDVVMVLRTGRLVEVGIRRKNAYAFGLTTEEFEEIKKQTKLFFKVGEAPYYVKTMYGPTHTGTLVKPDFGGQKEIYIKPALLTGTNLNSIGSN